MTIEATIIVPTFRRKRAVHRLLVALEQQSRSNRCFEVIVVVDGSDDGTLEMVEGVDVGYELRGLWQKNRGRAAACNRGIRDARGSLVIILDDDMEPSRKFIEAHVSAHEQDEAVCVMGAVPILLEPGGPRIAEYYKEKFDFHLERLRRADYRFMIRDFFSGNISVPRDLLLDAGLFDEDFRIYGNEDLDLAIRLRSCGAVFRYEPEALAYQYFNKGGAVVTRDALEKGRSAVLLLRKHPDVLAELRISTFGHPRLPWRMMRRALLLAGKRTKLVRVLLLRLAELLELSGTRRVRLYYDWMLDYFFWVGVDSGIDEFSHSREAAASTRLLLYR